MISEQEQALILESIRNDVARVGIQLKDIAAQVMEQGISDYPIFVASHDQHLIGKPVFDPDASTLNWTFHASFLEEFVQKGIIQKDKLSAFYKTYHEPQERACIFVLLPEQAQFIFAPYELSEEENSDM